MAAKYRKIDPRIWTDEKFVRLTPEAKLLAMWLLTSTRVNRCGVVLWSPSLAAEETGIDRKRIDTVLDTVCDTVSWRFCRLSRTLFLGRWWRYNRPDNESALKGALADLHDLPANSLKDELRRASADLPAGLRPLYYTVLDTVYDTVSNTVSPQEQEQEQEQKTPHTPRKRGADGTLVVVIEFPPELDTPAFRDAWAAWKTDRAARRIRPYTPAGERKALAKLATFGAAVAIQAIEDSTANGWQGLFPEKVTSRTRPHFETTADRMLNNLIDVCEGDHP